MLRFRPFTPRAVCPILAVAAVVLPVSAAFGYANASGPSGLGGPHRKINEIAFARFVELAAKDPVMAYYDFEPSRPVEDLGLRLAAGDHPFTVDGRTVTVSGDWYKEDVSIKSAGLPWVPTFIEEQDTTRTFKWWIVEGGYTADEPESYMALRHFYDPTGCARDAKSGEAVSYLTDDLDPYISPLLMGANPRVDAKEWALSKSPYSLKTGGEGLGEALTGSTVTGRRELMGRAWRSAGEAMHLLADMTVPAHVRNDSHPGALSPRWENIKNLKSDPYEDYVTAEEVEERATYAVDPGLQPRIDKCARAGDLFDLIAKYTNSRFFSTDTISGTDAVTRAHVTNFNGQPKNYDSPKLDSYTFQPSDKGDGSGYYSSKDGGLTIARRDADGRHRIDRVCAAAQANRMVPIAIAANVKLLDCLIPRVKVQVTGFDLNSKVFRCRGELLKRGDDGGYAKTGYGVCPTSGSKAIVFTLIGEKKNYWLPISKINDGDFEIDGSEFYADLARAVNSNKGLEKVYYAVGMDMGGIIVKSDVMEQPVNRPQQTESIKPEPPKPALDLGGSSIYISLGGYNKCSDGEERSNSSYIWRFDNIDGSTSYTAEPSKWSGNSFAFTGTESWAGLTATMKVEGTLSADHTAVAGLKASRILADKDGKQVYTLNIELANVPLTPSRDGAGLRMSGGAKQYVRSLDYKWLYDQDMGMGGYHTASLLLDDRFGLELYFQK